MNKVVSNPNSPSSILSNTLTHIAQQRKKYAALDKNVAPFKETFYFIEKKQNIFTNILPLLFIIFLFILIMNSFY